MSDQSGNPASERSIGTEVLEILTTIPRKRAIISASSCRDEKHQRGALGHHDHIAFCALDRMDVDRFYREVITPLEKEGHCSVEDPPCDSPEYGEGYYAAFFYGPDGLKYEHAFNPNHLLKKLKGLSHGTTPTTSDTPVDNFYGR